MASTPLQLLHAVVLIANRAAGDPPRALQNILRLLKRRLSLADCRLLFLSPNETTFRQQIGPAGPARFLPCRLPVAGSPAGLALGEGRRRELAGQWFFPLTSGLGNHGVLVLKPAAGETLAAAELQDLQAVGDFLAALLGAAPPEGTGAGDLLQWQALSAENDRKYREISLLYRLSRAMHGTLRLNELMHLILSAATLPDGGGFERAMLFMVNERSGTLQGMLGVTREAAAPILPTLAGMGDWDHLEIDPSGREAQRQTPFCRQVAGLRFSLDADWNPLARAVREGRVYYVAAGEGEGIFPEELDLDSFVCAPLLGRNRILALLVVDNPSAPESIAPERLRFLELFVNQAAAAMENSMLVHRLETAHQELWETQERLIQGEKMAVLGEMAASVAHELKNPLVAIGGFAQRLQRRLASDSREQEYAAIIAREVQRMEQLLGEILAFSKKNMLCFAECQLAEVIASALALVGERLEQAGVRTTVDISKALPPIQGDGKKLCQVVINLVDNARQAMERTGGELTLRAFPSQLRGEPAVTLEVADTGGGISLDVLRNIFNPFFSTKTEGTGLGLPISHRIVEHHRGEIEVQNREFGAAFIVRLPVAAQGKAFH